MEFGKFKNAEELLRGYNELEKSYTQKCQQLKQYQSGGTSEVSPPPVEEASTTVDSSCSVPCESDTDATQSQSNPSSSPAVTTEMVQQFLQNNPSVAYQLLHPTSNSANPPSVMTGGGNVSMALPSRPKTIKEASILAKKLFE